MGRERGWAHATAGRFAHAESSRGPAKRIATRCLIAGSMRLSSCMYRADQLRLFAIDCWRRDKTMSGETISCACPKCGKKFNLKAELAGKRVVCKACGNKFEVRPQEQQATVAAEKEEPAEAKAAGGAEAEAKQAAAEPAAQTQPAAPDSLDAPIPIDDAPIPVDAEAPAEAQTLISTKAQQATQEEEVKVETSGPYYVAKVFLTGKMVHVKIEEELNKYANLGWHVCQMLQIKDEAYVVFENPQRWKEVEERLKQGGDGQS